MPKMRKSTLLKKAEKDNIDVHGLNQLFGEEILLHCLRALYNSGYQTISFDDLMDLVPVSKEKFKETILKFGIKLEEWSEDFVDEDTGEVVTIYRHSWYVAKS